MEREASASSIDMAISVSFKGAPLELPNAPFPTSTTVGQLQMLLRDLTGIEVAHQKLIHRGRTLVDPTAALGSLLPSSPLTSQQTLKLALIGATAREIRQLEVAAQAAAKRRGRVVDDLVLLSFDAAAARRPARGGLRRRQYGFGAIEVLPGLPEQERARAILEELAQDPGVLHVMATFKWNVGALCELYPEGYVGVSDVCVMGLNQNKGQKILLRLRTDDLKGWRKILSIKKVLFHELAHNEHSEHDDDFYRLMRRVEKEVVTFNSSGRSLGGGATGGLLVSPSEGLVREAFVGGSGRLGGESAALTSVLTAGAMAGLAAAQRKTAEEQEIEDACPSGGRGGAGRAVHARPHDAGSPLVDVTQQERRVVEVADADAEQEQEEKQGGGNDDGSSNRKMDVSDDEPLVAALPVCCAGHGEVYDEQEQEQEEEQRHVPAVVAVAATKNESKAEGSAAVTPLPDGAASGDGGRQNVAGSEHNPAAAVPLPTSTDDAKEEKDVGAVEMLRALGFKRAVVVQALRQTGGNVQRAADRLVGAAASSSGAALEAAGAQQSAEEDDDGVSLDMTTREGRAVMAARRLVREETRGDAAGREAALSTLRGMIQAVLDHPADAKYKRVRLSNAKFQRAVGRYPAALELLRAVGFEERTTPEGEALLELTRNDAGLLWLGRSALEAEEER